MKNWYTFVKLLLKCCTFCTRSIQSTHMYIHSMWIQCINRIDKYNSNQKFNSLARMVIARIQYILIFNAGSFRLTAFSLYVCCLVCASSFFASQFIYFIVSLSDDVILFLFFLPTSLFAPCLLILLSLFIHVSVCVFLPPHFFLFVRVCVCVILFPKYKKDGFFSLCTFFLFTLSLSRSLHRHRQLLSLSLCRTF